MKRITCSLLLLISISSSDLFGQSKFKFGVVTGINFASRLYSSPSSAFNPSSSYQTDYTTGALTGIEFGAYHDNSPSYVLEILFDQKGYGVPSSEFDADILIDYLEVPFLVKIPFLVRSWRPYVFIGPTVGFCIRGDAPVDAGIYGGIGITHSLHKNVDFFFQAGYSYGIVTLASSYYQIYSRDIRINFGILFGGE